MFVHRRLKALYIFVLCYTVVSGIFLGLQYCFVVSEYKKAKQDLKKATAETNKWQKKVKKGELGEHDKYLLHLKIIVVYLLCDLS